MEALLRLQDLCKRISGLLFNYQRLQAYRAVEVLERIGAPQGHRVLQTLARGSPGILLTMQGHAALERLE